MNPLHTSLAFVPLAIYIMVIGIVNYSRRPFLTTGARDLYGLGLALCGLAVIGPLDLFLPEAAVIRFGPYIWLLLILLYSLCLTLLVLVMRPRLVVYNLPSQRLRLLLEELLVKQQWEHHWAGDCLSLPAAGIELQLDRCVAMRNTSLVATPAQQNHLGWFRLEKELAAALRTVPVDRNPAGGLMIVTGLLVISASMLWIFLEQEAVKKGLAELLRF
ncbi:MAG: hypothetical protein N2C12_02465 [Planctomycetales bacterium]